MDNKIEVLNRLLNEVNRKLKLANERKEKIQVEREIIGQELEKLYDYKDKLEKRRKVLEEIIKEENLMSGIIVGPDMTAIVKKGATITSPLYPGEAIATEIHMIKSRIAQEAAEEIKKRMERNHKHGKV